MKTALTQWLFGLTLVLVVSSLGWAQATTPPEGEECDRTKMTAGSETNMTPAEKAAVEDSEEDPSTDPMTDPNENMDAVDAEKTQPGTLSDFAKKMKNPTPWLNWGYDLRLREIYQRNPYSLNKHAVNNEWNWQRYRSRAWATITPIEDIELRSRLVWEFRHYCKPDGRTDTDGDEAIFDKLNVHWKNAFGTPTNITVGRQDIILGDGWLVLDGTPLDGSRTIYFDAVRIQTELKDINTTIQGIYIDQAAEPDKRIKPFNDREKLVTEQDERGAILWIANKSIKDVEIDGYFIYKHDDRVAPNEDFGAWAGDNGDIYTYGMRIAGKAGENWGYRAEIAQQLGNKNQRSLCALGANSRLTYFFNDEYDNQLRLSYEYLSGDKPGTDDRDESFDPLWGRWPQFSELLIYTWTPETRIAEINNMHRIGMGWTTHPNKNLEFCLDYNLLFTDQNTYGGQPGYSESGCFRGQLASALLRYKFTEFLSGHAIAEFFFPGDYYDDSRNDTAMMLRYELMFHW